MTTVSSAECLACIIDALDAIACRAVTLKYCDEVAAHKHVVIQVRTRAELILRLINAAEPRGLRLVKK